MNKARSAKQLKQAQTESAQATEDSSEEESTSSLADKILGLFPEFSQTWFVSFTLHIALLVLLAIMTLATIQEETISLNVSETTSTESLIETPLEFEDFEESELETEMTEMTESFEDTIAETEMTVETPQTTALYAESDFGDFSAAEDMGAELAMLADSAADGASSPKFFKAGATKKAKKIVYIVDNSNSMTGKNPSAKGYGRMETALVELGKSVQSLEPGQQFYIVFYSDTAYGLFHPQTVNNYVNGTYENKKKVIAWLDTIQCCLRTEGKKAFEVARILKPDLIYILGDGSFTDKAHEELIKNPIEGSVVHTLGMNLQKSAAERFAKIAEVHNGTYKDVGITKDGRIALNKVGPRRANNVKGPIWGVTLPKTRKKKKNK